jgi:hypothetical protein
MRQFDRNKSLQQLEGEDWGKPTFDSHLVTECHRLHRVPLRDFTIEDLRIMIGQHFSMEYLVPLALEQLRIDPLVEGAFYHGDLLAAVLRAGYQFWQQNSELRDEAAKIGDRAFSLLPTLDEIDRQTAQKVLAEAYDVFKRQEKPMVQ